MFPDTIFGIERMIISRVVETIKETCFDGISKGWVVGSALL